jgi:UDPglucose--hexose-1-phosphate uridylyltransferase
VTAAAPKHGIPADCPFCINNDNAYKFSIKEIETENIYVIPNKYPAYVKEDSLVEEGDGIYEDTKSIGGHEVIIIKKHDQDIYEDGKAIVNELLGVYKERYSNYDKDPVVEYTMVIHNHGPEAAASIEHPHSQLFASAIVPNYIQKEISGSKKYFDENHECVFCKIVKAEKENQQRVIFENEEFIAFTFFAARFPFEIWVVPKKHKADFAKITSGEQEACAEALHEAISKLNKALNFPPFNYWIHSIPCNGQEAADYYHWHLEIAPRVSKFGGYEMGSGIVIDVVSPEIAAEFLKK